MENSDNHVSYYKTTVTSTNYTFYYEDASQNKNEKSKNYEWKNEKNCNGKRSRKKNYQAGPGYYNQNKKREIYKKEKNQFTDNEKSNYYPVRDNKQKKINFKNIKNNIFFDNNNNENCEGLNNSEINKHHHYSRNKNNVNNFSKYNRNIAAFIKNEQRAYYDSNNNNANINSLSSPTNSDDNFRLTKELLEDLDKRNKDMDEENDGTCDNNNNNTNDFLIYVKKKIEEKKENVTKRRKNNWVNNEHYQENNFDNNINDNYISPDKKDNDCNNVDNSYKYTKEASSESGNYNEYIIHNVDTYKTINNDNISVFSDESTRVFINKKNKVSINMCDNPCDMWYGLKDRNGKNVFIDSVKNRDYKKQKKKKKISSKTKKYYINKKKGGKYDKWGDNYYGIANSDASSISGNTIATMHIDGNNKYNKKNIFSNSKNNIPYNSNGTTYNNENNNNPSNFKIFYNKNNLNNTQNDKMQKKNIPNHNYHQLAKNDIKNKNNIPWSGKNNIINNNSYNNGNNYGHKNQFELSKNIKNSYYDNKTINTSIRIKLPDNKISTFAENFNQCTSDTISKSLNHINNGVNGDLTSQNINNSHISDNKFNDNCINSNNNNNDDSINDYYYNRGENKRNMLSDYMNSALSSAVGYNDPNRNPPIENNHINRSENKFQNGINNVNQNGNYEHSEKNIFNNNNVPTYKEKNNMNYNLELHQLKLNNISNYSEANIVEYPAQNNQPNNALMHTPIDGVGINNRAYYSQTNNQINKYNNGEGITISHNNETYGIGNLTNYNGNNANNLHSNIFSNNCKDSSKEAYMSYSSIVTKSLPHINDMNNNNYTRQGNQDYTNNTNFYNMNGNNNNNQGQEGIANKIEDNNINKNDLQNNNVNITNPNNTNDHIFPDQNQSYKNNYYNNTKFDLSYEMDDDMRRIKKKKKWNVSFDYKSTFKSARERVQSLLASRRGVKY